MLGSCLSDGQRGVEINGQDLPAFFEEEIMHRVASGLFAHWRSGYASGPDFFLGCLLSLRHEMEDDKLTFAKIWWVPEFIQREREREPLN